MQSNKGLIKSC